MSSLESLLKTKNNFTKDHDDLFCLLSLPLSALCSHASWAKAGIRVIFIPRGERWGKSEVSRK